MISRKFEGESLWYAFLIFLLLISWTQIADYDFWWHIHLGKQVAAQGTPFVKDTFSYTFAGSPQFNGEWFGDLLLYLAYAGGGFPLVNLLKFMLLAATFYFLRKTAETILAEHGLFSPLAITTALMLIAFAIRFRLFVRPFLFSYLFVALFIYLLTLYQHRRQVELLVWLPLLELLWVNTSKGFFYGPVLVTVWIVLDLVRRRFDRRLFLVLAALMAVSFVNPEGLTTYRFLYDFAGLQNLAMVGEQQPLSAALLWKGGFAYTWGFQALVLLALLYFVRWQGWRDMRALTLFVLFLLPAVSMIRMIDFFALASVCCVTPALARLSVAVQLENRFGGRVARGALTGAVILLGIVAATTTKSYKFGAGAERSNIPGAAIDFLERHNITGRSFNSYPFGGYIPWRLAGATVYIDGRVNQLYPPEFHKHYFELIHTRQAWEAEQQKWGFEVAIIEYDRMDGGRHFPRHLADNPEWALVFWDDHSAVWLKRVPHFAALIEQYGYRLARPAFYEFDYLQAELKKIPAQELLRAARHDAGLNPDNQEARLAYIYAMYLLSPRSYQSEIVKELQACLQLAPDLAIEHSALAMIFFEIGRKADAAVQVRQALELDPQDKAALYLKAQLSGVL